jgi:hypothetical protein
MVERRRAVQSVAEVAAPVGATARTVCQGHDGVAAEGEPDLRDRSSRPHGSPVRPAATRFAACSGGLTRNRRLPRLSRSPRAAPSREREDTGADCPERFPPEPIQPAPPRAYRGGLRPGEAGRAARADAPPGGQRGLPARRHRLRPRQAAGTDGRRRLRRSGVPEDTAPARLASTSGPGEHDMRVPPRTSRGGCALPQPATPSARRPPAAGSP